MKGKKKKVITSAFTAHSSSQIVVFIVFNRYKLVLYIVALGA
jgi:hypothetical protein